MNRRTAIIVGTLFLAVIATSNVAAQSFVIEYSEGLVEVRSQNQWVPVYPGDSIERSDVLRLGAGSYAELGDGVSTLRLVEDGTFQLGDLVQGRSRTTERNVASMIWNRLDLLTSPPRRSDSGAGGVRGSEAFGTGGLDWVDGESTPELVALGREALAAEDIDLARTLFEDAVLFAFPAEKPEATFYLGYTYYLAGDMRSALTMLETHPPTPDSEYYHEHVLVLAQTELELSMGSEAVALLHTYVANPGHDPELVPVAHLLLGLGYRMTGEQAAAMEQLQRVQAIAPDTSTATVAAELLANN